MVCSCQAKGIFDQSGGSTAPISSDSFPTMINAATFYWYFSYPLPAEAIARV